MIADFTIIKSEWPNRGYRIMRNEHVIPAFFTLLEDTEKALKSLRELEFPSICTVCGAVKTHEVSDPFYQLHYSGVWTHYDGCKGWD
jgi:hypothetical protein